MKVIVSSKPAKVHDHSDKYMYSQQVHVQGPVCPLAVASVKQNTKQKGILCFKAGAHCFFFFFQDKKT